MNRPKNDKQLAQRRHAKRRAQERFGLEVNHEQYRELVRQIQVGKAQFIERQFRSRTHWWVTIDGKQARVVYDKDRHTIITFLPEESVQS
jgi:hypothetical protein